MSNPTNSNTHRTNPAGAIERLRRISAQELLVLGLDNVAYVRAVEVGGNSAVMICAANGAQIAIAPDLQAAVAAAWEKGLAPVTVH